MGSAGEGPASLCPSLAAPRTCSPLLPTPQCLPGTRDFVFVDLFASSPAGSEGRREAAQPGWLGTPGSRQPPPFAQRPLSPRAGNLETGQVSSWGRDVGRDPPPSIPSAFRESLRMANGVGLNKPTETGEEPPPSRLLLPRHPPPPLLGARLVRLVAPPERGGAVATSGNSWVLAA